MNPIGIVVIAFLVTLLLAKSRRAGAAALSGVVTICLLFAAFPTLGPAVTSGAGAFAEQIGHATGRAANTGDTR